MSLRKQKAFSLIELSIVILIIGILIIGITKGSRIIREAKLSSARSLTKSAPVASIANLAYWFEPTSATSFKNQNGSTKIQDGDTVSAWVDSNPLNTNNLSVSQATPANQPQYISNGVNGLPSIRFDITNDNQRLYTTGLMAGYRTDLTYFIVFKYYDSQSPNGQLIDIAGTFNESNTEVGHYAYVYPGGSIGSAFWNGSANEGTSESSTGFVKRNQVVLLTRYFSGARAISKFVVNKTTIAPATGVATGGSFGPGGAVGIVIGNNESSPRKLGSDISEIIIYDRVLTDSEIKSVQDYLTQKYNIK